MRKEEIACNKQFLLFSQCFPKLYIFSASAALCGNGITLKSNVNNFDRYKITEIISKQNIN